MREWAIGDKGKTRDNLLSIQGLETVFEGDGFTVKAVDNLSLDIGRGEVFGLVGESGSGKTMTALSVLRLVPVPGRTTKGKIVFDGLNILDVPQREIEAIRGGRIGMVFQEPMTALNPVLRVGDQISEAICAHRDISREEAREEAMGLLEKVGFSDRERYYQYPHQMSGGQRQRILIAMAVSCDPDLIIADEPTTALDVATEAEILFLLKELTGRREVSENSLLLITHNLQIVRRLCDRLGVMYAGRMMETAKGRDFFDEPLHPYSKGLVASVFGLHGTSRRLIAIPGFVPRLNDLPRGCKFHPRCSFVMDICREQEPHMFAKGKDRWVRCYLYQN